MWRLIRQKNDLLIIVLFMVVYNLSVDFYCLRRYRSYNAGAYDFGIAVQTLWNTARGDLLAESVNMGRPASRFWNGRWEIIFIPIGWLYGFVAKPEFILVLQTFVISLGIMPVYALSLKILGGTLPASVVSLCYMANPVIHNANLFDFHSVTLAIPFLVFLFFYTWGEYNAKMLLLFFVLALSCRADLAPMLAVYAISFFLTHRKGKYAATLLVLSVVWFALSRSTPQLREFLGLPEIENVNIYSERWEHLGGTHPLSIASGVLQHPSVFVKSIVNIENGKYLVKILAPFAFLPLFAPLAALVSLPNIFINATSSWSAAHHIFHHYNGHIGAVLLVASILAIAEGERRFERERRFVKWVLIGVLFLATVGSATTKSSFARLPAWRRSAHHERLDRILGDIGEEKSISSHFLLLDHVAHRREVYLFPDNVGSADLVVYDIRLPYTRLMTHAMISHRKADPLNIRLKRLLNDPSYGVTLYEDGLMVFGRGGERIGGVRELMEPRETDGFSPRNIQLSCGMSIEGVRENEVVGVDSDMLSFSLLCRPGEGHRMEPLRLVLTDGEVSHRASCHTMMSSIRGSAQAVPPGGRYVDELFVRLPGDLRTHARIYVYVQERDRAYRLLGVTEGQGE